MLLLSRQPLLWHSKARQTYFAIAVQIYGAMMAVYWGAQFIPSGWISIIFGLSPFITALLTALWLGERSLTWDKLLAYLLGVGGLALIFSTAIQMSFQSVLGILSALLAVFLQALSAVWVKRLQAKLPALTQVTGGLIFATPLYLITWWIIDGVIPTTLPAYSLLSILYLGLIATPIGFALYYYVLTHLAATRVALITLVSPVLALLLGYYLNEEVLTVKIIAGTGLILCALLIHSFVGRRRRKAN